MPWQETKVKRGVQGGARLSKQHEFELERLGVTEDFKQGSGMIRPAFLEGPTQYEGRTRQGRRPSEAWSWGCFPREKMKKD